MNKAKPLIDVFGGEGFGPPSPPMPTFVAAEPENIIRSTSNHKQFRIDPLNRDIDPRKVERLRASIRKRNLLHLFPIVVGRDLTVIDGQHRLKAAESLGVPIYYLTSNQMVIEDAALVSGNVAKWEAKDFLNHWCKLGNPNYIAVRDFADEFNFLPLSLAYRLCHYGEQRAGGKTINDQFVDGEFIANDVPFARRVAKMAMDFKPYVKFWRDAPFVHTLRTLASNADYDHHRMLQKMAWQSAKLIKCADVSSYLTVINDIYNHKVQEANRVHLMRLNHSSPKFRIDRNVVDAE